MAESIGRATDIPQRSGVVPVHDLGAHDPDVLHADPDGRLDEPRHRILVERCTGVDDQDEVGALRDRSLERGANRTSGPEPLLVRQHPTRPERATQHLPRGFVGSVIHREHPDPRIGLMRQREQAITQPRRRSRADHDQREHAWCETCRSTRRLRWRARSSGRGAWALREPSSGCARRSKGGRFRPPSRRDELELSASWLCSSCGPACERPTSSPCSSCGPACEPPSSSSEPACELRSSSRCSSGVPACGLLSSSCEPACARPSSCAVASSCVAGLRAAVFLRAVLRRPSSSLAGLPACRLLGSGLPPCRLAGRRPFRGGPLPCGCLPCCHSRPPFLRGLRRILGYDAIRLRRRRSRSLIPPHTPYRSSRRSA